MPGKETMRKFKMTLKPDYPNVPPEIQFINKVVLPYVDAHGNVWWLNNIFFWKQVFVYLLPNNILYIFIMDNTSFFSINFNQVTKTMPLLASWNKKTKIVDVLNQITADLKASASKQTNVPVLY